MERRVDVVRCYRCWRLEHLAKDCTGRHRKGCCFVCGEEGHRSDECKGEEWCAICDTKTQNGNRKVRSLSEGPTQSQDSRGEGRCGCAISGTNRRSLAYKYPPPPEVMPNGGSGGYSG
ncbi:DNA-binding protein HEXBP-like [Euwallacea fornicatus]|uniref:DNA-binding protein HEXBP-like n=1 Tax=Euwallacea fornicatus TaxID=995702 RepID=UPI00339065DD